jgi:hypothetical protein
MRDRWGKALCGIGRHSWRTVHEDAAAIFQKQPGGGCGIRLDGEIQSCVRAKCHAGRIIPSDRRLHVVAVDLEEAA